LVVFLATDFCLSLSAPAACRAPAQTAFVSLDRGAAEETGADTRIYAPLPALLEALPPSAAVLVAAYANDTAPGAASGFSFFET
jgi:hypothetical protein